MKSAPTMKGKQETDRLKMPMTSAYEHGNFGGKGKPSGFRANQPAMMPADNTKDGNGGKGSRG